MKKMASGKSNHNSRQAEVRTTAREWEHISEQLKQWSLKPDSYILEEFYTNIDIPERTFTDNCDRYPFLQDAKDFAKLRLGINREKLAIKRGENINTTNSFVLPHYFTRFKEQVEWRNELKAKANPDVNLNGSFIIETTPIEKTPEVDKQIKEKVRKNDSQD